MLTLAVAGPSDRPSALIPSTGENSHGTPATLSRPCTPGSLPRTASEFFRVQSCSNTVKSNSINKLSLAFKNASRCLTEASEQEFPCSSDSCCDPVKGNWQLRAPESLKVTFPSRGCGGQAHLQTKELPSRSELESQRASAPQTTSDRAETHEENPGLETCSSCSVARNPCNHINAVLASALCYPPKDRSPSPPCLLHLCSSGG